LFPNLVKLLFYNPEKHTDRSGGTTHSAITHTCTYNTHTYDWYTSMQQTITAATKIQRETRGWYWLVSVGSYSALKHLINYGKGLHHRLIKTDLDTRYITI